MAKTIEQIRAEASTPEFLKMYNDAVTGGMSHTGMTHAEAQLRNDYIRFCQGELAWQPEFSQFTFTPR